jgi:hypothetical protein
VDFIVRDVASLEALSPAGYPQTLFYKMNIELKEWMTPIIFEGVELSPISIAIDHLGMYGNLPELSDECSEWLWRFTICHGVSKEGSSKKIRRIVNDVLSQVKSNKDHLLSNVPLKFDGKFSETHLKMWTNDLETMLSLAIDKDVCQWTAKELRK